MKSLQAVTLTIMSSDLEAAIAFYTERLGLQLLKNYGGHYAELQAPGLKIGLHPAGPGVQPANNLSMGLGVTNFDGEVSELRAHGIPVQVSQDGPVRLAHFTDPDGNPLFLAEVPVQSG